MVAISKTERQEATKSAAARGVKAKGK